MFFFYNGQYVLQIGSTKHKQQFSCFEKSVSQAVWYVIFENVGIRATDDSSRYPSQRFTIELHMFVFDVL